MRRDSGFVLIAVMVALVLVASVALMLSTEGAMEANLTGRGTETRQAEYLAQAALQHALWQNDSLACAGDFTVPTTSLGTHSYAATATGGGTTTAHNLSVDQDAWIRNDQPATNNGSAATQHIRFETGNVEQALYRFDLSSLPANAQIDSASVSFYATAGGMGTGGAHPEGPVTVHRVTADWTEGDATWDTMNGNFDSQTLAMITPQDDDGVSVQVNLTAQVQAWVNGEPNYGILLAARSEGVHTQYTSSEGAAAEQPRLEVVVGSGPISPVSIQATGTLANGVTRTLSRPVTPAYQAPSSVILQLGTDPGADTLLDDFYPRNYGGRNYIQLNGNPSWLQSLLLRFDLGGVPARASVLSARLELRMRSLVAPGTATAHRVTRSWVEGTGSGSGQPDGATWATYDGTNNWTSTGGDFNAAPVAETAINGGETWVGWEIGPLVGQWLAGEPNDGLLIQSDGALREAEFYTQEEADATLHPKLTITYACECGSACLAPQGSGNVLLVVEDPTNLLSVEAYKRSLIESWGYTVTLIDDNAIQQTFNTELAANDVVYVSASVSSGTIGGKLNNATIGIVNEEGAIDDILGFSSAQVIPVPVGDSLDVTDNSHYITQMFPAGPLEIYAADMGGHAVSGALAPGLQGLANWGTNPGLAVIDTGAALGGARVGQNATGRLVLVPFGQDNTHDWSKLNNNGRLIMQRALAWGMNADAGAAGNLLFVAASTSPTAQEQLAIDLIESWGYGVTVIDDNDSQGNFDTAVAAADVAYISGDVSDAALGTKLTAKAIGIVNEQIALHDELGFSQSAGTNAFTNIFVVDNSHSITTGFATGWLTIATSDQPLNALEGTLAPGLQDLADVWISGANYDDGLALLDTGAQLYGGGTAAGRRAQLPWGAAGFDVNALNDNGRTIMQRAIEWGGMPPSTDSYAVLMVVADPASLTPAAADRKALMESWSYTVTLIDDDDSSVNFATAIDAADVIYVGSWITATDIVIKVLLNITKGVVNESASVVSTIGFSSSTTVAFGTDQLTILDNTHSITQGFPSPVTVFTALAVPPALSGTLSPDLQNLAEALGAPAVAVLETGARRHDPGTTPGRRAQLPFAGAVDGDLTGDGELIVQRAIEWAAGAGTGPFAHWKLDDGGGTTAIDSEGSHDGTLTNGPNWVTGQLGDALDFDGSDDHVDLTSDAELDDVFVGGATVMAWIEPAGWGGSGYGRIFDKSTSPSATGDGWAIRLNTDNGGLNFGQGFTGGRGWWRFAESSINVGTWHHVAVAYDASSTANDPIVYLDGSVVAVTRVDSPSGDIRSDAAINLRLGGHASATGQNVFDGKIDDARVYDRILSAEEIADIVGGGGGGGGGGGAPSYVERHQPWSAGSSNTWQTVDLSGFGVPASAVVEVAVTNGSTRREHWGGVRAVGSSLERRFQLHEAEGDGVDAVVMHAQANGSGEVQHYAESTGDVTFTLLGYWTGAAYEERFDNFSASNSGSWEKHDLASYGVGPNQVAEIVMQNASASIERLAGVRPSGASYQRRINIHEAESGGVDAATMLVNADASSIAEIYASNASDIDFFLVGYWSTPPGTYTETGGVHGQVSTLLTWESTDLTSFGVPANSVAQFITSNESAGTDVEIGVRRTGSALNRIFNLQEAEAGGSDVIAMHVNVDASSRVEWYAQYGSGTRFFYPLGWWVLP